MAAKADDPSEVEKARFANNGTRLGPELAWAAMLHVWNDGLPVALTILLPSISGELRLSYMQAAMLRTLDTGVAGATQIPLAALVSRGLEIPVMGMGLVWFGMFTAGLGLATTFLAALALATVGGIGGGSYHPIATNRVARLAPPGAVGRVVGTLNFAGDVGKFLFPAAAGVLAATVGWRTSLEVIGSLAALTGMVYLWNQRTVGAVERSCALPRHGDSPGAGGWWGIRRPRPFALMTAMTVLDSGIRSGTITFLPFLLAAHGFAQPKIGGLFAMMLIGGGIGKLLCGWLTDMISQRLVIAATEVLMAAGTVGLTWAAGSPLLIVYLVVLGAVLNGTSSVFYAGIADLVDAPRASRGYGILYTGTFAGSAVAPAAYGVLADRAGLGAVFWGLGLAALAIPVLALFLPAGRASYAEILTHE
jgi:MFS transporter, FSR family, fosmidomycin resistance protein